MKTKRRDVFTKMAVGTTALAGLLIAAKAKQVKKLADNATNCPCESPATGPLAKHFTNAVVTTHHGRKNLFYDDLLRDKIVLINFMSIATEAEYSSTKNLLQVQQLLGDRLGQDYHMYSITVDPALDTVQRLRAFAQKQGVGEGWQFLTGSPEIIEGIKARFFIERAQHRHTGFRHGHRGVQDCSMGLARYGNVGAGTWGSVMTDSAPEWIVKRLQWVAGGQQPIAQAPRRRGPNAIANGKPWLYDSGNF